MNYARVCVACLTADVDAAPGGDPNTCSSFTATLRVFSKFSDASPSSGSLRAIDGEVITGFNIQPRSYSSGDDVVVAQTIDETWVIVDATSMAYLLKTPLGGIPARSGTTAGKADCTLYYIDPVTSTIAKLLDSNSQEQTVEVFNVSRLGIAALTYIQAKRCNDVFIADMEDCT